MNLNNVASDERITKWRFLRDTLKLKSNEECIELVVDFISTITFSNRTIDYYTPSNWPTPWDILHNGLFCVNGISLLAYHTLKLANVNNVEMILIEFAGDVFLLPLLDDKYLINFTPGSLKLLSDFEKDERFRVLNFFAEEKIKQIV